jgi:hypothetical protein
MWTMIVAGDAVTEAERERVVLQARVAVREDARAAADLAELRELDARVATGDRTPVRAGHRAAGNDRFPLDKRRSTACESIVQSIRETEERISGGRWITLVPRYRGLVVK